MSSNRPLRVARQYRTHPDSKTDGGVTVVVVYKNGTTLEYPDVKKPDAYIAGVHRQDIACEIERAYVK